MADWRQVLILQAYAAHGKTDLSLTKLGTLLAARYGTLADAKTKLGSVADIRDAFEAMFSRYGGDLVRPLHPGESAFSGRLKKSQDIQAIPGGRFQQMNPRPPDFESRDNVWWTLSGSGGMCSNTVRSRNQDLPKLTTRNPTLMPSDI